MAARGTRAVRRTVLLALLACWHFCSPANGGESASSLGEMLEDAELNDVFFLDCNTGWAAGDRGAIWWTNDGGRHWRLQNSPAACRLESVCFVDALNGWIVGGRMLPHVPKSEAVVLRTCDGGRRWTLTPSPTLPALRRVKFFDAERGWAVGNSSAMYPSGVFRTEDGGRSWTPSTSAESGGWLTGDFLDMERGAAAGRDGALSFLLGNTMKPSSAPRFERRHLRSLRIDGRGIGWLAGDGGLALRTDDGGRSWKAPSRLLPEGIVGQFDFRAVAQQGDDCWIAGSPGSCVLHWSDAGSNWEVFPTEQTLPVRAIAFADGQHGWAVGALGTILASSDGGRSWRRQHSGGQRAALVGFFSDPANAPWELFALLSGNEGYLGVLEILNRRDVETPSWPESPADERTRQAALAVGASGAETAGRFPLRQPGLPMPAQTITDGWDRWNDGRGLARLEEHIVQKIRQWRPDVIVTEQASPRGEQPLSHLVNQVALSAVSQAADAAAYPDQIRLAGLTPWRVQKVFSTLEGDRRGTVSISGAQLAVRLGRSLADQAAEARGLVEPQRQTGPQRVELQLLWDQLPHDADRQGVFNGIALEPGGGARRLLGQANPGSYETLSRAAQKHRNVQQLLALSVKDRQANVAWLGQLDDLTRGLTATSAGEILFELGRTYQRAQHWELSGEVLELLVTRHPDHPLASAALLWLVHYHASAEAGWVAQCATQMDARRLAIEPSDAVAWDAQASWDGNPLAPQSEAPQAAVRRAVSLSGSTLKPAERAGRAVRFCKMIQRTQPALFSEPAVRFPLAAALRTQGLPREAERVYRVLAESGRRDAWRSTAEAELWLARSEGQTSPKAVAKCRLAEHKPRLDGLLEDDLWQTAKPLELQSAQHDDAAWPAAALFAYDGQFLYVAVSCRKAPAAEYPADSGPRPRDPDLSQRDRVDLLLDVNRDYATFYRLTADHRGWTGESCLEDETWNPEWFVAVNGDVEQWTVEAAIPFRALTPRPPSAGDAWAVGAQRIVPGVGFQSWTQPAAVRPRPEGFGLLLFE